jgi:hypothetical protein
VPDADVMADRRDEAATRGERAHQLDQAPRSATRSAPRRACSGYAAGQFAYFFYTYEDLLICADAGSQLVDNSAGREPGPRVTSALIGEHWDLFAAGAWMDSETDAADIAVSARTARAGR